MEKSWKKPPNDPLNFSKLSLLIKEFIEPVVLYNLYHENLKTNVDLEIADEVRPVPIIVGGSAIDSWLKSSSDNTKTKDYDIRLVYPTSRYNKDWRLSNDDHKKMMEMAFELTVRMTEELNLYIYQYQNEMFRMFDYYNFKVTQKVVDSIKRKKFFSLVQVHNNLFTCQYEMETEFFNGVESAIDIFPVSNNATSRYYQLEEFRTNAVLSDPSFIYPIPTTEFFGVYFAALGYCIWDLVNILSLNIIPNKRERNKTKLHELIKVLNKPQENLNCRMTEELIENCQKELQGGCTFNGKQLKNQELIRYGTQKNLFPDQAKRILDVKDWLGDEYLCDYIKRYQDRIFIE
jgi:hypothetical protein